MFKTSAVLTIFACFLACALLLSSCELRGEARQSPIEQGEEQLLGAVRKDAYRRPEDAEPFPLVPPLVVVRGTWKDMGNSYGEEAGKLIAAMVDSLLHILEDNGVEEDGLREELDVVAGAVQQNFPGMYAFMEGIAEGASGYLERTAGGKGLDPLHKVLLVNCFSSLASPGEDTRRLLVEEGSSWSVRTGGKKGRALAGANVDGAFYPLMYRVALVVVPDDPEAGVYFSLPPAGGVGGPVGVNQAGVFVAATAVWEDVAVPGGEDRSEAGREDGGNGAADLPLGVLCASSLARSSDADSALQLLLHGPEAGAGGEGKAVLPCRGANILVSDRRKALVLERAGLDYAVREEEMIPGDGSFCAATDHFAALTATGSEEGTSVAETVPDGALYSRIRLRSLEALLREGGGDVDAAWAMRELAAMDYVLGEGGEKIFQLPDPAGHNASCLEGGLTVNRLLLKDGKPFYGTVCSLVVDLEGPVAWYELGLPTDWTGPWERINLGEYLR
jgi:hypothetical protein